MAVNSIDFKPLSPTLQHHVTVNAHDLQQCLRSEVITLDVIEPAIWGGNPFLGLIA